MTKFTGKVICGYCNKPEKRKKARKKIVYVCSTYDNYGKSYCKRNKVDEDFIILLLQMRIRNNFNLQEAYGRTENIIVKHNHVVINMTDSEPIISTDNYAQF